MAEQINWGEAPEGATHWGPETNRFAQGWYKFKDDVWHWYEGARGWLRVSVGMRERSEQLVPRPSSDALTVAAFADRMAAAMAEAGAAGREGWDDPARCSVGDLAELLIRAVRRGKLVSLANYAMMLDARGGAEALREELEGWLRQGRDGVEEWDGRGFPPLGTMCEFQKDGEWIPVRIVGQDGGAPVICGEEHELRPAYQACGFSAQFRRLRTEAERAAEERESAIHELRRLVLGGATPRAPVPSNDLRLDGVTWALEVLYDAGKLKP